MTATPPVLPPLRDLVRRHGLDARRTLGQHFLFDGNLTGRIARAAGDLGRGTVVEIGPGPGGLTRALLEAGACDVIAIERDRRCLPLLADIAVAWPGALRIVEGDALAIDVHGLGTAPRRVVANLPYNIATALVLRWLAHPGAFASMTLMFQKEVAARLAAAPRDDAYGRLSVAAQWHWQVTELFDINPRAFVPPPQVTSTVVQFIPRAAPVAPADPTVLERVTAAAFGQRRKMLRASLRTLGVDTAALLEQAAIEPTRRAEELSIAEFAALARALDGLRGR